MEVEFEVFLMRPHWLESHILTTFIPPKEYQIPVWCETLLGPIGTSENLTVVELVNQFPVFRAQSFITLFTRSRPWICPEPDECNPRLISVRSSSHLCLVSVSGAPTFFKKIVIYFDVILTVHP